MSNHALSQEFLAYDAKNRQPYGGEAQPMSSARPTARRTARSGLVGLLTLGLVLGAAAGVLGARTWHVGSGLGAALFPVEDIVELAAVAVGTVLAGWVGLHALVALAWVVANRRGLSWAAGERTVARHAPAVVRRLARASVGAGLGLALATPTASALPARAADGVNPGGTEPAVVLDLGWQSTARPAATQDTNGDGAGHRSGASGSEAAPERSSLVNRGMRTGAEREPLVIVEPGDTLWAIAADRLTTGQVGADPSDAEIAAAVTRWHRANREALGTNPDLIHPGTVLRRP